MKAVLWTFLSFLVILVVGGLLFIYSGAYNVGALTPRGGFIDQLAAVTMDHSVEAHASGIVVPDLRDSSLVNLGFEHYREMCVTCHGSPAGGMSDAGMGLNPPAPELSEAIQDLKAAEVYWIVKNGVKMTGMPAFGPTHSERELWAIVAFLQKLKTMTPEQYKAFVSTTKEPAEPQHGNEDTERHDRMSE